MSIRTPLSIFFEQRGINLDLEDLSAIGLSNRLNVLAWLVRVLPSVDLARLYALELKLDEHPELKCDSMLQQEIKTVMKGEDGQSQKQLGLWRIAKRINDRPALPDFRPMISGNEDLGRDYICWVRGQGFRPNEYGGPPMLRSIASLLVCLRPPRDQTKGMCLEGGISKGGVMYQLLLDTRSGGEMNFVFTWENISWFRSHPDSAALLRVWHKMIPKDYSQPFQVFEEKVIRGVIHPYCPAPE